MSGRAKKAVPAEPKAPETAPAAAPASGEVLVHVPGEKCPECKQALPHNPDAPGHVKVLLKQDVLLNGVHYLADREYLLPEDAFHTWKNAVKVED